MPTTITLNEKSAALILDENCSAQLFLPKTSLQNDIAPVNAAVITALALVIDKPNLLELVMNSFFEEVDKSRENEDDKPE